MPMDTSVWIRCNPKIAVEHSTKKYYGQYLYKLVLYAPAGRIIHEEKTNVEDAYNRRITVSKNINFGGYWGRSWTRNLDDADLDYLKLLKNLKHDPQSLFKFRIEEPYVQVYSSSLSDLEHLATNQIPAQYHNTFYSISGPKDTAAEALLNRGAILRKKDCGYKYKVICRDGNYGTDIKHNLLNYIKNLDLDTVYMTTGCRRTLENNSSFIWNMYLYTNDISIVSFLNLICPGLVSNYHELVTMADK